MAVPGTLLLAAACSGGFVPPAATGTAAGTATTTLPATTPATSGSVEQVPGADLSVNWSPAGGAFVDTVTVTLSAALPDATVRWAIDEGGEPAWQEADGPITLDRSAVLLAQVHHPSADGPVEAQAYLRVTQDLADFSSGIPLVLLWTGEAEPEDDDGPDVPFALAAFEPPAGGRVSPLGEAALTVRAGVEVRGSSTANYPKKPYGVEFWQPTVDDDLDAPFLGMSAESDWVFLAPYNFDRAFVRNALIYELSREVGRWAPHTAFVELFVTDGGRVMGLEDYRGVYVVVEEIKRGPDRVDITGLGPDDLQEPEVSGGYIWKVDRLGEGESGFVAGTAGGVFDVEEPLVHVDPKEEEIAPEQVAWLTAWIDDFAAALANAPSFTHPATGEPYTAWIDRDAWIDHHVLNVWTKNPDAFRLSGYHHKDREGRWLAGPIWDFDRTLGCALDSRCEEATFWDASNRTSDTTAVFTWGWYGGLFEDPDFRSAYFERLGELLDGPLSEERAIELVEGWAEVLREPAERNFDRWPDVPPRDGSYDAEIAILEEYIRERVGWMRACLELPDPRTCPG